MSADLTLTSALARVAYTYVKDAKVGIRRGSVAAFAVEMSKRGVKTSKSTLGRKLDGIYALDTDDIAVIADIVGVEPNVIFQQALSLMNETPPAILSPATAEKQAAARAQHEELLRRRMEPAPTLAEHITRQLSPEAQEQVRRARAEKEAEEGPA